MLGSERFQAYALSTRVHDDFSCDCEETNTNAFISISVPEPLHFDAFTCNSLWLMPRCDHYPVALQRHLAQKILFEILLEVKEKR